MYRDPILTFRHVVQYGLIALITLLIIAYAVWQARLLIIGPTITLAEELNAVQPTRTITLSGQAANIVGITLNGRTIYTDKNGNFTESIILENGYTMVTIEGTDRYGRNTILQREFVYTGNPS